MALNTLVEADRNAPAITRMLAEHVAHHPSNGWSVDVDQEAVRTFTNWLGCAVGAAQHETAEAALAAINVLQPSEQATILGRREKVDIANAALINGITSHTFDFDDTHLKTIIHPAGPVASALLALAELKGSTGRELLDALVLGIDVSCRIGNTIYPDHYDRGWHITGTTGTLGAAAGCARLLGLSSDQTAMALGIAASQPVGLREQFGTMTKPFHPGAAAKAGLMSALLAQKGFTASPKALEAPRGFVQVISPRCSWTEISDQLGERFEISFNTYKPFACGIVIHPSIDACVQLREKGIEARDIERIDLRVHPLVLELTGKTSPIDGLQGKFSVYHGCAVGLLFGEASEDQYSDQVVNRPDVVELRNKIRATVDGSISESSADVTAVLKDGRRQHIFVEHAIGSLQRPMSNSDIERKFVGLAAPVIGHAACGDLLTHCWSLATASNVEQLVRSAVPAKN